MNIIQGIAALVLACSPPAKDVAQEVDRVLSIRKYEDVDWVAYELKSEIDGGVKVERAELDTRNQKKEYSGEVTVERDKRGRHWTGMIPEDAKDLFDELRVLYVREQLQDFDRYAALQEPSKSDQAKKDD